jgi:hypothetical protein
MISTIDGIRFNIWKVVKQKKKKINFRFVFCDEDLYTLYIPNILDFSSVKL